MKNADQPITPLSQDDVDRLLNYPAAALKGLTKREHFAAMAMQGLLSNPYLSENKADKIAYNALINADELLLTLENNPENIND